MKLTLIVAFIASVALPGILGGLAVDNAIPAVGDKYALPVQPPQFYGFNSEVVFDGLQASPRAADEVDGDEIGDESMEEEMSDVDSRMVQMSPDQLSKMVEVSRESLQKQMNADSTMSKVQAMPATLTPYVSFASQIPNWNPERKCCPRAWRYQCRSYSKPMPCFRNYYHGRRETCCPIWPRPIYVARCQCSECAVQTSTCIHKGRCAHRYAKRSFVAICYSRYPRITYMKKYVPTSCYCNAKRNPYTQAVNTC